MVDGRWGASLEINPKPPDEDEEEDEEAAQWEAHQALAKHFSRKDNVVLTPEQLETLRSLGYIR